MIHHHYPYYEPLLAVTISHFYLPLLFFIFLYHLPLIHYQLTTHLASSLLPFTPAQPPSSLSETDADASADDWADAQNVAEAAMVQVLVQDLEEVLPAPWMVT